MSPTKELLPIALAGSRHIHCSKTRMAAPTPLSVGAGPRSPRQPLQEEAQPLPMGSQHQQQQEPKAQPSMRARSIILCHCPERGTRSADIRRAQPRRKGGRWGRRSEQRRGATDRARRRGSGTDEEAESEGVRRPSQPPLMERRDLRGLPSSQRPFHELPERDDEHVNLQRPFSRTLPVDEQLGSAHRGMCDSFSFRLG